MHRLIKIRVIRDLECLEERTRRWMDTAFEIAQTGTSFRPPVDFYETPQGLVLLMDVAGVAKEDLSLVLAGQKLVIRGRRLPPPPQGVVRFLHLEMGFGAFERTFLLPIAVDPQEVQARYLDGILEIQLPRKAPVSRQIPVKDLANHD